MTYSKPGICFYPTTIGLVDDNKEYLKHLMSRLTDIEQLPCKIYHEPEKALNFLTNQYQSNSFINHCLVSRESSEFDHLVTDLNIAAIHQEIYNSSRFNEVSILVVDFAMPGIDGLELARSVRKNNPYIKIIMLTGEAGHNLAISAFNEGSIDQFILKTTPNVMEVLVQAIRKFQQSYFLNLSEIALNKIADFSKQTLACLNDPAFIEFFAQVCKDHHITEYYLLDTHGSFLLLNMKGKPSILAVADEEIMATYQRLAADDHAPASVIDSLQTKKMIPYFYSKSDFDARPAEWEPYLSQADILQGKETYCCAYIADLSRYEINMDKISSYQQFLENI